MDNGCWLWQRSTNAKGYAHFRIKGKTQKVSHYIWEATHGPIPVGLQVLHNCPAGDNPSCVNPDHLWLGTNQDNVRDKIAKGRAHGHPGIRNPNAKLTEEQALAIYRDARDPKIIAQDARCPISAEQVHLIQSGRGWKHLAALATKLDG